MNNTDLMPADVSTAVKLGLSKEEYERIQGILGRNPNFCELSIYSVMWSEHCSYKNSIKWLKTLPRESSKLLAKAGEENAGLMDIGEGWACCFKIESHNHPSALEPYQGAATGVGGINRDIFSMGARPVAQLNSLRFGNPEHARTKWLVKGVVKGIGDYGNAFGIPTVGGEVYFDSCYHVNPLVNAMSVGIVRHDKTVSASSGAPGHNVYIFGASTGKDGIHGAAFASKDINEDSAKDLPSVQVGDPFWEKLILEATMEIIEAGCVAGLQDMGAAGITCSTSEMSAKEGNGMDIWLDRVPLRQAGMKAWEILLSESQERMLAVVKPGMEQKLEEILKKWDITFAPIGKVTDTGHVKYYMNEQLVADIPAQTLVLGGGAPVYERSYTEPEYYKNHQKINLYDFQDIQTSEDLQAATEMMLALPNIASKRWIYNQYDSMVGAVNLSTDLPSDAAVVKIRGTKNSLTLTVDCNARYVYADPEIGAAIAVAEAARNIACTGGEPLGVTNCLNFGNPYNPGVYWQFVGAIKGMGNACLKFDTPVTGGNVSFYNQSNDENAVFPTPTIGMIGIIKNRKHTTLAFQNVGDLIYMLGTPKNDLGCSQYITYLKNIIASPVPSFNIDEEKLLQTALLKGISENYILSAHDCSEGGLLITLLESAFSGKKGFNVSSLAAKNIRKDAFWFGESQGRAVVSLNQSNQSDFENLMSELNQPYICLGNVFASDIIIDDNYIGNFETLSKIYNTSLEELLT